MTTAEKFIKDNKIRMSLVVEELGYDPQVYQGVWTERVRGKAYMTAEQAANLEEVLEDLTNKEIDEPLFEPVKFKAI